MASKQLKCLDCGAPAKWVRMTQFAGDHYFCDDCSKKQHDFGREGNSYFFWDKVGGEDEDR